MAKKKKKIRLTEEQYNAYISSIKDGDTPCGAPSSGSPSASRKDESKKD